MPGRETRLPVTVGTRGSAPHPSSKEVAAEADWPSSAYVATARLTSTLTSGIEAAGPARIYGVAVYVGHSREIGEILVVFPTAAAARRYAVDTHLANYQVVMLTFPPDSG